MKKMFISIVVLVILCLVVLADKQKGLQEQSAGEGEVLQVQTEQETQNIGEAKNLLIQQKQQIKEQFKNESKQLIQERQQLKAQTKAELKELIQQKREEIENETKSFDETKQKIYKNQNAVRLAVHSLLAMENRTGGIGPQISQIAREFNNSVQATIRAEERIQRRSRLLRLLVGGDEKTAEEIEQEVSRNQQRIQQLIQLREKCDCDEEIKAMLQEQIQNMEQEQTRLKQLAQAEKKIKGIFRWLLRKSSD